MEENTKGGTMEDTSISLVETMNKLKKRWKLILMITLAAGLISGAISYLLLTPIYQASAQILVNQKDTENQFDANLLQSNVNLINTYSVIIKSPAILEKVIDELHLKQSVEDLNKHITVDSQENSQVFSLSVENPDAAKAAEIANTVSQTFQNEIQGIMNVDNVSILAKADVNENPLSVRPNPVLNIVIAVVAGLMLGMGIALLLNLMDTTLKDDEDVAALLGVPVLGSVQKEAPNYNKEENNLTIQKTGSESSVS